MAGRIIALCILSALCAVSAFDTVKDEYMEDRSAKYPVAEIPSIFASRLEKLEQLYNKTFIKNDSFGYTLGEHYMQILTHDNYTDRLKREIHAIVNFTDGSVDVVHCHVWATNFNQKLPQLIFEGRYCITEIKIAYMELCRKLRHMIYRVRDLQYNVDYYFWACKRTHTGCEERHILRHLEDENVYNVMDEAEHIVDKEPAKYKDKLTEGEKCLTEVLKTIHTIGEDHLSKVKECMSQIAH
ncbi:uncharacterized protein LOC105187404 isoform X2 [Harpegnathos saltator]|uniref:Venom protein n=2 Tax=Harpegnathos saltator TaxID=610380 RepID=E2BWR6_HARSA|nr:uncharacterized protein LOC105187404 isoform X2 [Harpegnathos saltator]EFN79866.1 hypothetical protein EAI_00639 [Harpegnathos saltator]